ncbi:MFS transporter [Stenotrophomonas maltophilia]|uniref:MFS transporter n=1 Tax=Stenotrophomonas maltophilia TaxID=40324 RepID=UPI001EF9652C|nr:MFS transporter [Stenotrophomonas maltophilia]
MLRARGAWCKPLAEWPPTRHVRPLSQRGSRTNPDLRHSSPHTALNAQPSPRHLYAAGHFARTLVWSFVDLALGFYLHVRLGLSAAHTGQLLAISLAYSSVLDLLLAALFTRLRNQHRLALRLQLIGGLGTAASACLLFSPGTAIGSAFLPLLAASLLFRTCYAVYDVAQNALTSLLPRDEDEAMRYVSIRATVVPVSKLCIAAALFGVVGASVSPGNGNERMICMIIGILITCAALPLACVSTPSRPSAARMPGAGALPLLALLPVLLAAAAETALVGLAGRLFPFADQGAALTFAMVSGMVVAPWLYPRLHSPLHGETGMIALMSVLAVVAVGAYLALPSTPVAIACAAVHGTAVASVGLVLWRRTALIARRHAARSGREDDLSCFALLTGTMKLSIAASSLLLGEILPGIQAGDPRTSVTLVSLVAVGSLLSLVALAWPMPPARTEGLRR